MAWRISVVVPCYNEEHRFPLADYEQFFTEEAARSIRLIFVDDGSSDGTSVMLKRLVSSCSAAGSAELLSLASNQGKAEAVRQGMLRAMDTHDCAVVGYWDSDLATPLGERAQAPPSCPQGPSHCGQSPLRQAPSSSCRPC